MSATQTASHARHAPRNGKPARAARRASSEAIVNRAKDHVAEHTKKQKTRPSWFTLFAQRTAQLAGKPSAFILATAVIIIWGVSGPLFGYSDTWQLVINTGTTIVTFLMVFLIQHTQNRDSLAFQIKLDELIIKLHGAGNEIAGAEDLCDEDLEKLHETYRKRAAAAHEALERRRKAE